MTYRQVTHIPEWPSVGVFKLECVVAMWKRRDDGSPYYELKENVNVPKDHAQFAYPCEAIAVDYEGRWHLLSLEDYDAYIDSISNELEPIDDSVL